MKAANLSSLSAISLCLMVMAVTPLRADITLRVSGYLFQTDVSSQPMPADGLMQLVRLGTDGVFNKINASNRNADGWTSGDDSLLTAKLTSSPSTGFNDTNNFTINDGTAPDPLPDGYLHRSFTFNLSKTNAQVGEAIGIRWFPNIKAADFGSTSLSGNEKYGQFTNTTTLLQNDPANSFPTVLWFIPPDGSDVNLDALFTSTATGGYGKYADAAGLASLSVIPMPVPEPSAPALLLAAAALSLAARRRRSSSASPR